MTGRRPTAVVTGGGSGIGRAAAALLAADGLRVLLVGRRETRLREAASDLAGDVDVVAADCSTPEGARAVAEAAGDQVRALVCAAGGNLDLSADPGVRPTLEELVDGWRATLDANLLSAVLPVAALQDAWTVGEASVVLVSSQSAADGRGGPYATAKAAVNGLGRQLALQLADRGVRVNVVMPGFTPDTDFFPAGSDPVQLQRAAAETTLLGRAGTARDVAQLVHWLTTPAARHVNGQAIRVDGGATFAL